MDHSPRKVEVLQQPNYKIMGFGSAMAEVLKDKRVRRQEWEDKDVYLCLVQEQLMIYKTEDKLYHPLIITAGDIAGTDWEVIKEKTVH